MIIRFLNKGYDDILDVSNFNVFLIGRSGKGTESMCIN